MSDWGDFFFTYPGIVQLDHSLPCSLCGNEQQCLYHITFSCGFTHDQRTAFLQNEDCPTKDDYQSWLNPTNTKQSLRLSRFIFSCLAELNNDQPAIPPSLSLSPSVSSLPPN